MSSLTKATTVQQRDPHTYTIDFDPAWTIGAGTLCFVSLLYILRRN